jgi:hypothetical protein
MPLTTVKNTNINNGDLSAIRSALVRARDERGLNNEQLFKALSAKIEGFVDFNRDGRTAEYKEQRRLVDNASNALYELAKILH